MGICKKPLTKQEFESLLITNKYNIKVTECQGIVTMSNGCDVWTLDCKCGKKGLLDSDWPEGGII